MTELYNKYLGVLQKYKSKETLRNIFDRDIIVCVDNPKNKILLAGINPSWNPKDIEHKEFTFKNTLNAGYWKRYHNLFRNHINDVAYLDLFPLKHSNQLEFERLIKTDINLMVDVLKVTQEEIESLSPKLIIIANKRSLSFWGAKQDCIWMGYDFEDVQVCILGKDLIVKRIIGMRNDKESITNSKTTNLLGSIVLFYGLYDERHRAKFPNKILDPEDIDVLLGL